MTNTETCMREMRHILTLFMDSGNNFDEQWILFKAYLNTIHSLSDNDKKARHNFHNNELMNFALVLRNIIHHQPAKWHFGKHDVHPTKYNFKFSIGQPIKNEIELALVIQKRTLENEELQQKLVDGAGGVKQLDILIKSLDKIQSHVIIVYNLMDDIQVYVETYCKESGQYTEVYDTTPKGFNLIQEE